MLHFYRALSALVPLNWKIQGVDSIISPSTVRIVIVGCATWRNVRKRPIEDHGVGTQFVSVRI